ncbi:MAG: TIGR03790 family protein [Verrucomicrobiota bacterium]
MFKKLPAAFVFLFVLIACGFAQDRQSAATLVLYNAADPDSADLARYYASKRLIPNDQVVGLNMPVSEEITRADFNRTIANPLRKKMAEKGWWILRPGGAGRQEVRDSRIRFVALMRGVPMKISSDPSIGNATHVKGIPPAIASRNEASVDSELAALGMPDFTPAGIMPNPYFGRFTPILDEAVYPGLLLTARLDGPTPSMVRAMIDDTIMVEKEGLWGWAYIDGRDITSGGYTEGDNWMRNLVEMLRQRGVPTIFDNLPTTFPDTFPVTDAALYYGWYAGDVNGPFAQPDFRFKPGAVAVHIHSYSAFSLRSTDKNWCGPLVAKGAAATLGNVYEPYLSLTANLDVFQDRLMSGMTLAEAAWMSQRALSWMGVVIGDPLYKPYAAWNAFYDPRGRPMNPWRRFRSITLAARGNILDAILPLHEASSETGDSMFLEALGNAQADVGHAQAALDSFRGALKIASGDPVKKRLELEIAASSRMVPPDQFKEEPVVAETGPELKPEDFLPAEPDPESPLSKPAPTPPPLPTGLPNLPYPDL